MKNPRLSWHYRQQGYRLINIGKSWWVEEKYGFMPVSRFFYNPQDAIDDFISMYKFMREFSV